MFAKILRPMYDHEGRKYIDLDTGGDTRRVKIPWRYNRVMSVKIEGLRPLQDMKEGEMVQVEMIQKFWQGKGYWILSAIKG